MRPAFRSRQRGFLLNPARFGAAPAASTSLIDLPMTGTSGSTSFPDSGSLGLTWTANGDAQVSTVIEAAGALILDGSGDFLSASFANSTLSDFRIRFSAQKSANGVSGYDCAVATDTTAGAYNGFFVELSTSRGLIVFLYGQVLGISYSFNPNDGVMHDYDIQRIGSAITAKIDGVQVASSTNSTPCITNSGVIQIGRCGTFYPFNGTIKNFKLSVS